MSYIVGLPNASIENDAGYTENSFDANLALDSEDLQLVGNVVLDFVSMYFPQLTDNFKKWLREEDTEHLNAALKSLNSQIAEMDAGQAKQVEKAAQDIGIWTAIAGSTGSQHVKKAHHGAIKETRDRSNEATKQYALKSAVAQSDKEKLDNMRHYPDTAYNSIGELRQDYYDVINKYHKYSKK